jgi:hypothetical protein
MRSSSSPGRIENYPNGKSVWLDASAVFHKHVNPTTKSISRGQLLRNQSVNHNQSVSEAKPLQVVKMPRWILGDKFDTVFPHKGSLKVLWESRWKFAVCFLPRILE